MISTAVQTTSPVYHRRWGIYLDHCRIIWLSKWLINIVTYLEPRIRSYKCHTAFDLFTNLAIVWDPLFVPISTVLSSLYQHCFINLSPRKRISSSRKTSKRSRRCVTSWRDPETWWFSKENIGIYSNPQCTRFSLFSNVTKLLNDDNDGCLIDSYSTRWCPSSLAKVVCQKDLRIGFMLHISVVSYCSGQTYHSWLVPVCFFPAIIRLSTNQQAKGICSGLLSIFLTHKRDTHWPTFVCTAQVGLKCPVPHSKASIGHDIDIRERSLLSHCVEIKLIEC